MNLASAARRLRTARSEHPCGIRRASKLIHSVREGAIGEATECGQPSTRTLGAHDASIHFDSISVRVQAQGYMFVLLSFGS